MKTDYESHTPTPWACHVHSAPQWAIRGPDKFSYIALTSQGNDEANAARIVLCVNSHDALLDACKALLDCDMMFDKKQAPAVASRYMEAYALAKDAIRKATHDL